jgi:hypothetical protein
MKKLCLAFLMLGLALVGGTRLGLAQDLQEKTSDDAIASMLRDGWTIKQDGVLQRDRGPHQTETFVFGSAGFTWKLQDLQNQLRKLRQAYLANPTPELRKAILNHRKAIANTQKIIALTRDSEESGKTMIDRVDKASCNISFGYSATASYLTSQQGVTANASANFSSNCSFSGEVYAYSISEATVNGALTTQTLTDGPRSGSSVTASANTSQTGLPSCDSYAYASMTSSDFSYEKSSYSISASNYNCPAPLTITFAVSPASSSASPIQLNGTGCTTVTWTATPSGGTTPRTTTIYVNGTSVGNVTTYSKSYCNTGTNTLQTIPAYAVVADSSGASKTSATVNTYIQNHAVGPVATITGPSYVYAGTSCVTSTWTASVSGGTSPYTYQWTWNGTAVGTGSSYSRSTCPGTVYSDTMNTLGLTVTDSASRTGSTSLSVEVEKSGSSGGGGGGTCSTCQIP